MRKTELIRKIAVIGCLAIACSLLPVAIMPAQAATWTNVASGGISSTNNIFPLPGALFQNKMSVGVFHVPWSAVEPTGVSCYTYDGTTFTPIPTAGFTDVANIEGYFPTAEYDGELYIGTYNGNIGGELYRWTGTGNPVKVTESAAGWGEGNQNTGSIPLGVINNKLVVCVINEGAGLSGSLRIWEYDGAAWSRIVGPGEVYPAGFGNANNTLALNLTGERTLFKGKMYLAVQNQIDGLSVYTYDGAAFAPVGTPGSPWSANNTMGLPTTSNIEDKVYLGTLNPVTGGEIWAYNGTAWSQTATGGMGDPQNIALLPLARGAALYLATWNANIGCRVFQKNAAGTFDPISNQNFGEPTLNQLGAIKSWNGKLYAFTANEAAPGGQVWSTPVPPSIDELVPNPGPLGSVVSINGHDLGVAQGTSTVTFSGIEATNVLSWSDTRIEVIAPYKAMSGPVLVTTPWGVSNQVMFTYSLSKTWYFAEGTTRDNASDGKYEEWICLQNPGDAIANVTLTYMLGDGTNTEQTTAVAPKSRTTLSVNTFLGPDKDVSTFVSSDQLILAERPMYFNYQNKWTGGHDVIGLPVPRDTFYFAEGTTRANQTDGYFEEWLCFQNPGAVETTATVDYLLMGGATVTRDYTIGARSRRTVSVNAEVGVDKDVAAVVRSGAPIVCERPMYFNYHDKWTGGHDVIGAPAPDTTFYFAEGTTRDNAADGAFEEWICLQNDQAAEAQVTLTYFTAGGTPVTQDTKVPAKSRVTLSTNARLGPDVDASCMVVSSVPILAERPMYFNYANAWDGGHDVMGCSAPKFDFYFAEGTTNSDFATWVAILNADTKQAYVTIEYMLGDGTNKSVSFWIDPQQRYTRNILADVDPGQDVSIHVESLSYSVLFPVPSLIVVERPMYFNYHGWCTGGHDTLGYGI